MSSKDYFLYRKVEFFMGKVRFTAFADLHYAPEWFKSEADERLAAIQKRAIESRSDMIVSLGDFSHFPTLSKDLIDQYNNTGIPNYHVLGNHEFDHDSLEEVVSSYGMPNAYYSFEFNGFRFIMLDNNTFSDYPGVYFHYSRRNYFDHGKGREYIAPEQVEWFRETVKNSTLPCTLACNDISCWQESRAITISSFCTSNSLTSTSIDGFSPFSDLYDSMKAFNLIARVFIDLEILTIPSSRRNLFISPVIIGTAYVVNFTSKSGLKFFIAFKNPTHPI